VNLPQKKCHSLCVLYSWPSPYYLILLCKGTTSFFDSFSVDQNIMNSHSQKRSHVLLSEHLCSRSDSSSTENLVFKISPFFLSVCPRFLVQIYKSPEFPWKYYGNYINRTIQHQDRSLLMMKEKRKA